MISARRPPPPTAATDADRVRAASVTGPPDGGPRRSRDAPGACELRMSAVDVVRTVTVTGSASVSTQPDRASLSLGVQSRRPSCPVGALAIVDERAATAGQRPARRRRPRRGPAHHRASTCGSTSREREYVASYTVNVTVPADDVGRFLDAATEVAGDELTMNGVSFSIEDPAPLRRPAARALAVADARPRPRCWRRPPTARSARSSRSSRAAAAAPSRSSRAARLRMAMAAPIEAGSEVAHACRSPSPTSCRRPDPSPARSRPAGDGRRSERGAKRSAGRR